jgi:hypothetical protein
MLDHESALRGGYYRAVRKLAKLVPVIHELENTE